MPWFLTALNIGTGLLLVAIGLPLMRRRVPPNTWYGARMPSTLASEPIWYAVNAQCGRDMMWLGVVTVALATLEALVVPPQYGGFAVLALCAVVVIGALALALRASRYAAALQRNARLK